LISASGNRCLISRAMSSAAMAIAELLLVRF
jgi:hypothetical protein